MHSDSDAKRSAGTSDDSRGAMKSAVDDVKSRGRQLADEARRGAARIADEQKQAAANYVLALASAINSGTQELERQGLRKTTSYASAAAEELTRLGNQISDRQPSQLLDDLETFARRRPALFFGAAFVTGVGLARFFKSAVTDKPAETGGSAQSHRSEPH